MSPELQDLLFKALYAGHKYHLAVQAQMESITKGRPFDPIVGREQEQVDRYWTEWQAYTAKAIELHAREAQGESP
jgi:hypothetical protein